MVEIIPRSYLGSSPVEAIPLDEMHEGIEPWLQIQAPSEDFLNHLRLLLPRGKSWGDTEEYVSENEWESDLRIWRDDSCISNIQFRYSPAGDPWSLMQDFLSIVSASGYLLVERDSGLILDPSEEVMRGQLMKSKAGQFLHDPKGTILQAAADLKIGRENT
ncbi:MAG: hypothetical protein HY014_10820 [Acidobacteria bacterium]|nr:hypothetical protein [Acidobacteriota bacterium]MBI3488647.1 hypothetical protein [Acidobacteriota bacterium]